MRTRLRYCRSWTDVPVLLTPKFNTSMSPPKQVFELPRNGLVVRDLETLRQGISNQRNAPAGRTELALAVSHPESVDVNVVDTVARSFQKADLRRQRPRS